MINNRNAALTLFIIISIFTMVTTGCGGSGLQPQSKTTPNQPADAVVFTGTQHVGFDSGDMTNVMTVDIAFNQSGNTITGQAVPHTSSLIGSISTSCINLDQLTATGTISGSSFAILFTDHDGAQVNASGTISPLTGNYSINFGNCSAGTFGPTMTGKIHFQKAGA